VTYTPAIAICARQPGTGWTVEKDGVGLVGVIEGLPNHEQV
jgi:hypothetical protein